MWVDKGEALILNYSSEPEIRSVSFSVSGYVQYITNPPFPATIACTLMTATTFKGVERRWWPNYHIGGSKST